MENLMISSEVSRHPGWRELADRTGHKVGTLLGLWIFMVEHAAERNDQGILSDWNDGEAAEYSGVPQGEIATIMEAMQGVFLDGDRLTQRDVMWRIG